MYLVRIIEAVGQDTFDKDRALNAFEDIFQLANAKRYNSQYLYLIREIGADSYSF